MPQGGEQQWSAAGQRTRVASDIISEAARDLVFVMRFLGGSQLRLLGHFRSFIAEELARRGTTHDAYPLLQAFIDRHAVELRDFVFTGVALSRQFRIEEIERLTGDPGAVMRVDIWDQLVSHIETAERRFLAEADAVAAMLQRAEAGRGERERETPPDAGNR